MLERHSRGQIRLLTEMSNSIMAIQRSLEEVKENEAKRLKLEMERNKREEESQLIDMKIQRIEMSIQIKKLQLLTRK